MRSSVPDGGRASPGLSYPGRLRAKAVQALSWLKWTSSLENESETRLGTIFSAFGGSFQAEFQLFH